MYGKYLSQTNVVPAFSVALDPACLQHLITLNSLETQEAVPAMVQTVDQMFPEGLARLKVVPRVVAAAPLINEVLVNAKDATVQRFVALGPERMVVTPCCHSSRGALLLYTPSAP